MSFIPSNWKAGAMIRFTYKDFKGNEVEDPYKEIFLLNPNWQGLVHGLDLKRMTPAQVEVLKAIFDERYLTGEMEHPYPMVNDIIRRMDTTIEILHPHSFYIRFCKPFLRTAGDCYRTYYPNKMFAVQLMQAAPARVGRPRTKPIGPRHLTRPQTVDQQPRGAYKRKDVFKGPTNKPKNPLFKK